VWTRAGASPATARANYDHPRRAGRRAACVIGVIGSRPADSTITSDAQPSPDASAVAKHMLLQHRLAGPARMSTSISNSSGGMRASFCRSYFITARRGTRHIDVISIVMRSVYIFFNKNSDFSEVKCLKDTTHATSDCRLAEKNMRRAKSIKKSNGFVQACNIYIRVIVGRCCCYLFRYMFCRVGRCLFIDASLFQTWSWVGSTHGLGWLRFIFCFENYGYKFRLFGAAKNFFASDIVMLSEFLFESALYICI